MILDVIVEDKKKRLPEHKKNISEIKMRELAEKYEGKKHGFYQALSSVCSLSNLFFRFHTTTLTEACSNELKQHHL